MLHERNCFRTIPTMSDVLIPAWSIGERMAKARQTVDLDPSQMAARLGVTDRTIRNWENGVHPPKRAALLAYEQVTGVPMWWLEGDDGGDNPSPDTPTGRYPVVSRVTPHSRPVFAPMPLAA